MNILSQGIDISRHQGDFDMAQAVKEGFQFVILKAGGGDGGLYKDSKFEANYNKAKALGIPVGAYWFSKALNEEEARKEADTFVEQLKGKQFDLPAYMDVEHKAMLDLGKRKLTDVIHAFCQRMEELGFFVGIYSSKGFFESYMIDSELQRYAHWVACWGKDCNYPGKAFGLWQYGGETNYIRSNKVAGVVCDQNYLLRDYPTEIKAKGLNGFQKPSGSMPKPAPEDDVLVLRHLPNLKKGDTGHTVRALQALLIGNGYSIGMGEQYGIFGNGTENAVKQFQPDSGEVGPETWAKLLGV